MASYKDLLNLKPYELRDMSEKELKRVVDKLSRVGNDRLNRFEYANEKSPAYTYIRDNGGDFSTVGLVNNKQGLLREYRRVKGFLESETGTLREWRKVKADVIEQLKNLKNPVHITDAQYYQFFDAFKKLTELNSSAKSPEYKYKVFKEIKRMIDAPNEKKVTPDYIATEINRNFGKLYKQWKETENEESNVDVSDFF